MVQAVEDESGVLLDPLARLDPFLPLVHGLWDDVEVGALEEEADDGLLHVGSLLLRLHGEELIDLLGSVS